MSKLQFSGRTDIGMRRDHNEDTFGAIPHNNLFVVADGLGGYAAGEVASKIAVDTVADFYEDMREDSDMTWPSDGDDDLSFEENVFVNAVLSANQRIFHVAQKYAAFQGMSTTFVGAHFEGKRVYIAHVGDSRCYRVRDGKLEQLTEDHSLLNAFIKLNDMDAEAIERFPYKNVILRAIGNRAEVEVEVAAYDWQPGDLYLLCTDGLSGEVKDAEISELVEKYGAHLDLLTAGMIKAANDNGGSDNVTVLAVRVPHDISGVITRGESKQRVVESDSSYHKAQPISIAM